MSTSSSDISAVLYNKKEYNVFDDVWDDTELIKMYEKSTAKTYEKLNNDLINNNNKKSNTPKAPEPKIKWKVGDHCMAPYEEDGRWYPAKIESINASKGDCKIIFDGYNTKAKVKLNSLMTEDEVEFVSDEAEQEDNNQDLDDKVKTDIEPPHSTSTNNDVKKQNTTTKDNIGNIFPIPDLCPPPPNYLINKVSAAGSDREALTNALMSWYMAGYHTGFYQGLMAQRQDKPKNPRSGASSSKKNGNA